MNTKYESPDSSSPMVTRAVAAALQGQFVESYQLSDLERLGLQILGYLPQRIARMMISRIQAMNALDPEKLRGISIETLAAERLNDYKELGGSFQAVTIGAAIGGASAHLAAALDGPFLPQAFVTTLKGGAPDGNVENYFLRSRDLALRIAEDNPNILTIQHYDPIHDGWITRHANHLRFKLLDLPEVYKTFLKRTLEPGGAICYLDCGAKWLRFRFGERSVFQVGGWGGLSPQEFLDPSQRVKDYCRTAGFVYCGWKLQDYPLEQGPESEWGSEPGLGEALEAFCEAEGYRFIKIALPKPHDYAQLAYLTVTHLLRQERRDPIGVLVEMFSQFDATAVMNAGILPLWLVFNTQDSLEFLRRMKMEFPKGKKIFFSPLATFTVTPDIVPWKEWEEVLQDLDWQNIGTRPSHYPSDPWVLTGWKEPLKDWVREYGHPITERIHPEFLAEIAQKVINQ